MTTELGAILMGSGALSVVLAIALWFPINNAAANRYLSCVLLTLAGIVSVYSLGWTGRVDVPAALAFMPLNLPLALGPLLFGYVSALSNGRGLARPALHMAPAAAQFLYLSIALLAPADMRAAWKDGPHDNFFKPLLEAATLASLSAYAIAGLRLHRRYRTWLVQARSDADRYAAQWIAGTLITLLATLVALTLLRLYSWFIGELETGPLYLWFGAWSTWLGIEGWRYSERRFPVMTAAPVAASGPDWAELGARWQSQTQVQGWWREPDLSLADLAKRLGTNTSYLSQAVNDGLGMNFNEMINRMRAAEAARMIETDGEASLTQIAIDAGFSSKATFNRVFRAVYGTSPSELRRLKSQKSAERRDSEASNRV
ncbi:helix-turn-helix domain-containing protein [Terricaulis sp.]|uniref:helix-turn-helix domain-containing protein n=1 Tax=Terricaulis sp. TaxID=2768686 RepID=UPI003783AB70